MSEEINITNNHQEKEIETKCFCQSKGFRKFLITALGTFVGVYCALCLFSTLHRPPMIGPMGHFGGYGVPGIVKPCPCKTMHHHHFKHIDGARIQAPVQTQNGRQTPFETER